MSQPSRNISSVLRDGPRLDAAATRAVREAVQRLRNAGIPIASSQNGRITIEQPRGLPGRQSTGK